MKDEIKRDKEIFHKIFLQEKSIEENKCLVTNFMEIPLTINENEKKETQFENQQVQQIRRETNILEKNFFN